MLILSQNWIFEDHLSENIGREILCKIEAAGRVCYKSENQGNDFEVTKKFVKNIMTKQHESVLEHCSISVRIMTDRGIANEIVRHRMASYSQESTRYVNYFGDIAFMLPVWFENISEDDPAFIIWEQACIESEKRYNELLALGQKPQQARAVLNHSLKTEMVMTCNLREWRHFFKLRTAKGAHPQMRSLAIDMLLGFKKIIPIIFDDIE